MSNIVGTTTSVNNYLSKIPVDISAQSGQAQPKAIHLDADRKYVIPLFQREIRWEPANVNTLLSDLSRGDKFLGNIILSVGADKTCTIIDGQQRTTAMMTAIIMRLSKEEIGRCFTVSFSPLALTLETDASSTKQMYQPSLAFSGLTGIRSAAGV